MSTLPPELQREIFELAVRANRGDAALKLNLTLVAHHVRLWVEKVSYELMTITSQNHAQGFRKLTDSKPPDFWATAVKTLLLYNLTEAQAVESLSICSGVQALAVWTLDLPAIASLVGQLPLQRLSMNSRNVAKIISAASPPTWLASLTHLDVEFTDAKVSDLQHLSQLPRLTHVALYASKEGTLNARTVCGHCVGLRVLVITYDSENDSENNRDEIFQAYSFDPRIVVMKPFSDDTDWTVIIHFCLFDRWSRAERVLEERNGGMAVTNETEC